MLGQRRTPPLRIWGCHARPRDRPRSRPPAGHGPRRLAEARSEAILAEVLVRGRTRKDLASSSFHLFQHSAPAPLQCRSHGAHRACSRVRGDFHAFVGEMERVVADPSTLWPRPGPIWTYVLPTLDPKSTQRWSTLAEFGQIQVERKLDSLCQSGPEFAVSGAQIGRARPKHRQLCHGMCERDRNGLWAACEQRGIGTCYKAERQSRHLQRQHTQPPFLLPQQHHPFRHAFSPRLSKATRQILSAQSAVEKAPNLQSKRLTDRGSLAQTSAGTLAPKARI